MYSYIFGQIETGEIEASIDADGSVTFADDEPAAVSKAEIDRALRVAQEQEQVLRKLEREIARNKDYLQKVRVGPLCEVSVSVKRPPAFRQCETGKKAPTRTRLRTGLTSKKSCGRVLPGAGGLKNRCIEEGIVSNLCHLCPQSFSKRSCVSNMVILFCLRAL